MKAALSKLSTITSLGRLFDNDYLPKEVYDNLVTIFTATTAIAKDSACSILKIILTHPHCSEDTVKIILQSLPKIDCTEYYSTRVPEYYSTRVRGHFLTEMLKYQPILTRLHLNLDLLDPEVKEWISEEALNLTKPRKMIRTSEKLEHLVEMIQYIKDNPALCLTDDSSEIRDITVGVLRQDEDSKLGSS